MLFRSILARVLGCAAGCEANGRGPVQGKGLRRAIALVLEEAGLEPKAVGHVNAHGLSSVADDKMEARAIRDTLPGVPVTAPKSYFGNMGAAGGAMEMMASVMAVAEGVVPATRNFQRPDPGCAIPIIRNEPREVAQRTALLINFTRVGQAAAVVLGEPS